VRFGGGAPAARGGGAGHGGRGGRSPEERRDVVATEERRRDGVPRGRRWRERRHLRRSCRHGSRTWPRRARRRHRPAEQQGRLRVARHSGARLGVEKRADAAQRG
jgi:hypothetical protein